MLEVISGVMFGLGLAMFEWGLHQRGKVVKEEPKKVVQMIHPVKYVDDYEECLEDLMYETGMSDEELDEIMPDIGKDIEDWV